MTGLVGAPSPDAGRGRDRVSTSFVWYPAMSMDGRIASAAHSLDFLQSIGDRSGAAADFAAFLATVDGAVVGARTLRWLLGQGHGWPHSDIPTWLVSHDESLVAAVGNTAAPFRRHQGHIEALVEAVVASGSRRVWVCGGGEVAAQLLAAGAIDEVDVTVAPTVVGSGPSLFDGPVLPNRFDLVECAAAGGGAAHIRWRRDPRVKT